MKDVLNLYFLTNVTHGGFVTYTVHLVNALRRLGHKVRLMKVASKTENRLRPFADGIGYQNVSRCLAVERAKEGRALITCLYWKGKWAEVGRDLLGAGAALVLHDPTEYADPLLDLAREHGTRVVSVRKNNVALLSERGVAATFVPHPYVRVRGDRPPRAWNAVSLSRLDWDKHTDIIVGANALVDEDQAVRIYGAENRLYTHHKLADGWRANYYGAFPKEEGAAVALAAQARFVVDLSVIAGDGDGTQYTFLEAWDAGAVLVVNRGWIRAGDGPVEGGVTAIAVSSAEELADVLRSAGGRHEEQLVAAGRRVLEDHAPPRVVPLLFDACGWGACAAIP